MMPLTRQVAHPMFVFAMNVLSRSSNTRPAAVAGRFYPGQARALRQEVDAFLAEARSAQSAFPKALIAPHAGYLYSGPIAGSAFAICPEFSQPVRRVILIGPSHYQSFRGIVAPSVSAFAIPGGEVPVDREAVEDLERSGLVRVNDSTHAPEHALEVELPFLQVQLSGCAIVPLLVGDATGEEVAEVLDRLWGGRETLVVVSSDLSHYLHYDEARAVDAETRDAIERLEPDPIDSHHACGFLPIQGLLQVAKAKGLEATTLDLRNSGDTAGPRDQVVGYGAWAFMPREPGLAQA